MHKGNRVTIHVEDNLKDVCQVAKSFWIPHDFVESEEEAPTPINDVNP